MNQAVIDALRRKAEAHVMGQAMALHAEWVDVLSQPGSGRRYGKHTASAPGDPPAVDTGLLRQSIAFARLGELTWGVGVVSAPYPGGGITTAEVAVLMERGGRKVAMRPHARPALERFKAKRLNGAP